MKPAKIRFWIRKNCLNKQGTAPLYCYVIHNGKKTSDFNTGLRADLNFWNSEAQTIENDTRQQYFLEAIRNKLKDIEMEFVLKKIDYTANDIKNKFTQPTRSYSASEDVLQFFDNFIEHQKKLLKRGELVPKTVQRYRSRRNILKKYLQEKKIDVSLGDIDIKFTSDYVEWLKFECEYCHNYAMKNVQMLKQLMIHAIRQGLMVNNPLAAFRISLQEPKEIAFITPEELSLFENYTFDSDRLQKVADIFVFQCHTGLCYADAVQFQYDLHVYDGFDNRKWIRINRQKSNSSATLPLLQAAKKILDKYDNTLPMITNQKMNDYLKEIAGILGIEKRLTDHMARKTFGMLMLNYHDVSLETVAAMMGHKSIQTTRRFYTRILEKKIAHDVRHLK